MEPLIKIKIPLSSVLDDSGTYINQWIHKSTRRYRFVYIVKKGTEVLYVGITVNSVRQRLLTHMSDGKYKLGCYLKSLNGEYSGHSLEIRVFPKWIPKKTPIHVYEYKLIRRWAPALNIAGAPG